MVNYFNQKTVSVPWKLASRRPHSLPAGYPTPHIETVPTLPIPSGAVIKLTATHQHTNMLDILDKEINDIVQHHGQIPSDPSVCDTYSTKLRQRAKLQQRLMHNQKKIMQAQSQREKTPHLPERRLPVKPRNSYDWATPHGALLVQQIADAVIHTNNEKGEVCQQHNVQHAPHTSAHACRALTSCTCCQFANMSSSRVHFACIAPLPTVDHQISCWHRRSSKRKTKTASTNKYCTRTTLVTTPRLLITCASFSAKLTSPSTAGLKNLPPRKKETEAGSGTAKSQQIGSGSRHRTDVDRRPWTTSSGHHLMLLKILQPSS